MAALGVAGRFFTAGGAPLTIIECSDFSLFKRFLDREALATEVRDERRALGFNTLRVWLLNQSVVGKRDLPWGDKGFQDGGIRPVHYPDFYERLDEFIGWLGMYVELTIFTSTRDPDGLMPGLRDQQLHLEETAAVAARHQTVLLEQVNEADQWNNAPWPLDRPPGVLISRGSNGADRVPPQHDDPWDYELYHTNGLSEFQRKVGHNAQEWSFESGKPCISNENTRYPDQDNSSAHAYDAAMGAALLCGGSCYHSQSGKYSTLFTPAERVTAEAWVAGAQSVPLEFQRGDYRHLAEQETPEVIRVYSKTLPDGRDYVIRIRK